MNETPDGKVILEKPKSILLKIIGVVCKTSFKNKLIDYSIENCSSFLDSHLLDANILKLMPKIRKYYESCKNPDCPYVPWANFCDILNIEDENERKKHLTDKNPIVSDFKKNLHLFLSWSFKFAESGSVVNEIQNEIWLEGYNSNQLKAE